MATAKKQFVCEKCGKAFGKLQGLSMHCRDVHPSRTQRRSRQRRDALRSMDKKTKCELAVEAFGELSDGAFFAAAQSTFGLAPEDFLE